MIAAPVEAPTTNGVAHANRNIRKAAVLGAGIMGSAIALHLANIGVEVLLLDIAPRELSPEEQAAGLSLQSRKVRNRIAEGLFAAALAQKPAPVYDKAFASRITVGNFEDDMPKVADVDWIVEVVVERLDIKKLVYEQVEKYRKPGTLITSNTSGIPMWQLAEGRSEDFKKHFFGTHFFNPVRYLPLLELIPGPDTDPAVIDFLMAYGDRYLGKKTVLCKDTPAFIANRVGIYAIMDIFYLTEKYGLTVGEVDKLTGPAIGHPKSATFRTCDLVGLDTAVKVAKGIEDNCPDDERRGVFKLPAFIQYMVDNNLWGDKTKQGFYKRVTSESGQKENWEFDFATRTHVAAPKVKDPLFDKLKNEDRLAKRLQMLNEAEGKYGDFMRESSYGLFSYVSFRIPEIADQLFQIDQALAAGFAWTFGPFQKWDAVGVRASVEKMKAAGFKVAAWVDEMLAAGHESFYKTEGGQKLYYNHETKKYEALPGGKSFIYLDNIRENKTVWKNTGLSIIDLGDGIICAEFQSKMNTLGEDVIVGLNHAIDLAEKEYRGLVIGNQGENFSLGANLMMVAMMAGQKQWDLLNEAVRVFQNTVMRIRYSAVPVVVAPHTMTLGGGCEMTMHADIAQAAAETYIGLVEVGVGLIPAGGGTKEFTLRISDRYAKGDVEINYMAETFQTIATAKVATSAYEAVNLGILRKGIDGISVNKDRLLADAKRAALELADAGYVQPAERKDIRVLGRNGLGAVYATTFQMEFGGYASAHDRLIAEKIGYVICGGDLSQPSLVSEQYLLELEREAFLSLCGTQKTQDRIMHTLQTGKPLRN